MVLFSAGVLVGLPLVGQSEWPQWRGPEAGWVVVSTRPREGDWPAQPELLWQREVGEGYSGPIAARDRIWVHARRSEQEVVSSLRLSDGEELWARYYGVPFEQDPSAVGHGRGPYSTPSLADGSTAHGRR